MEILRCESCLRARLVEAFRELHELTLPECRACRACGSQYGCCDEFYCGQAVKHAAEYWGATLAPTGHASLPLMGPAGCTAAPHHRPICTLHTCMVQSLGFKLGDPDWSRRYDYLRSEVFELLWQLKRFTKETTRSSAATSKC